MEPAFLNIGGLVAIGFDQSGNYLLTVSHSGRGVFDRYPWNRVASTAMSRYASAPHGPHAGIARRGLDAMSFARVIRFSLA